MKNAESASVVPYPELKRILEQRFDEWRKATGLPRLPVVRTLASEVQKVSGVTITHSSLHDWLAGRAKPHSEKLAALAKFFAPENADLQDQIKEAIQQATKDKAEVALDPLDSAELLSRPLSVGVIPFEPFCCISKSTNEPMGFMDKLLAHFLSFSGLGRPKFTPIAVKDAEKHLLDGAVDLVLGLFVDPSRTRTLWFYHQFPILIPLNAVHAKPVDRPAREALLEALTQLNNSAVEKAVLPIIDPFELGGIYVRHYLGIKKERDQANYVEVGYDVGKFARELLDLSARPRQRLPLCFTDEVSCLKVRIKAEELAAVAKANIDPQHIGLINTDSTEHHFPRYRYGLAMARKHNRWIRFFEETFELFLESNTEIAAREYRDLYNKLGSEFSSLDGPERWKSRVSDWLSLYTDEEAGRRSMRRISPTWDTVLAGARALLMQSPSGP